MASDVVDDEYDYIVVGSGAGGGPVAANLALAGYRVLVLEAGGSDGPRNYQVPAFYALAAEDPGLSWNFYVRHYDNDKQQVRDRRNFVSEHDGVLYPRSGTLGGCTAHNAMIFISPHNSDWDDIAKSTGDKSWKASRMRRYFQRIEKCSYLRRPWRKWLNYSQHGYDGWLPVSTFDASLLLRDSLLAQLAAAAAQTCHEKGIWYSRSLWRAATEWIPNILTDLSRVAPIRLLNVFISLFDPNDWRRIKQHAEGPVLIPLTVDNGVRRGTRELLRETEQIASDRLAIRLNRFVTRVVLEKNASSQGAKYRATGVEYVEGARLYGADLQQRGSYEDTCGQSSLKRRIVRASREVILAGGTFNTPQILKLSGIGPCCELAKCQIDCKVDLPGVGENLQDRYEVGIVNQTEQPFNILKDAALSENDRNFVEWKHGYGLYTTNGVLLTIIKRSHVGQPEPDLFIFCIPSYFSGFRPGYSNLSREKSYFTWAILKGHTVNTAGKVLLSSANPFEPPKIHFRYFEEGNDPTADDLDAVLAAIEFVRNITDRTASLHTEIIPGKEVRSRADLRQFVRDNAWGHHACGTCKIGANDDPCAVLDSDFKVRGTTGLRVVDASVFPKSPGLFIVSAVYMIAEKASDAIMADARKSK